MRSYLQPVWFASLIWLLAGLLQHTDAVGLNYLSHSYERVWLWEMYDTITEIEGADKQKMIFGFNPNHPWPRMHNIGSGPDGKLTYAELQARLEKKDAKSPVDVDRTMLAPGSDVDGKPTIHECAQALQKKGWNKPMDATEADQSLRGHEDPYGDLLRRADKKFHQYRVKNEVDWKRFLFDKNKVSGELLDAITAIRTEDTNSWLYQQLQKDKEKGGLNLNPDQISVEKDKPSAVPGGRAYNKVDIPMTLAVEWRNLQDKGFKTLQDLLDWADNLGDPSKNYGLDYTEMNKNHWRALKTFRMAKRKVQTAIAELESCL